MEYNNQQMVAFEVLRDTHNILNKLDIPFWLDGGTLLGFVRDGIFCEGDEDDVDVSTWCDYKDKIPMLINEFVNMGYTIHGNWQDGKGQSHELSMRHKNNKHKVDIFFKERKGEYSWHCLYTGLNPCTWKRNKIRYFNNLREFSIMTNKEDMSFNIPVDYDGYLTELYGDWETPVNRNKWNCYNKGNAFYDPNDEDLKW
jgi:phosphorylcholine metabolism protein LicD